MLTVQLSILWPFRMQCRSLATHPPPTSPARRWISYMEYFIFHIRFRRGPIIRCRARYTFEHGLFPIIMWPIISVNENTCRYLLDTWREILNHLSTYKTSHPAPSPPTSPSVATLQTGWYSGIFCIQLDVDVDGSYGLCLTINRKYICELLLCIWIWIYSVENVISYAGTIKKKQNIM